MKMVKAKRFALAKAFSGQANESNFRLEEEELGDLQSGQALFEAVFLSVDPYMRPFGERLKVGDTMIGEQVAKVVESKNKTYPKGSYVRAKFGWRTHTVVSGEGEQYEIQPIDKTIFTGVEFSLALGTLGMPGATAYLGLHKYGNPKAGDVFLVNAAAGAVGHIVGQIAKIKGCKVIGYAGSEVKCQWLRKLGFDHVFNYKTQDLDKTLKEAAPNGVDIFWDHVGGDFGTKVVGNYMADNGRVVVVGGISAYNAGKPHTGPTPWYTILLKRLAVRGMLIFDHPQEEWRESFKAMSQWIKQGKLKCEETVTKGFENMPKAFLGLFTGDNVGKAVVKM